MATLGRKSSSKSNKKILLIIGIGILITIIIGSILVMAAFYFLFYKPSTSITTISNLSKINATTSSVIISSTSIQSTTTILAMTSTTSSSTTSFTTSSTSSTTIQSTTIMPEKSRIAKCFNDNGVKLYVNDVCLTSRCKGIKDTFESAFNELSVINCDEDQNEDDCDTAREDMKSLNKTFGFPLWYVSLSGEYYPGASVSKIQSVTGCN